ncbi:type I methionyl aminopeptidase [Buchnera aphidicola (Chaitoregma tattakana)]|uniref:type I methionyl aminopeptidase n=1 Tax=Buchnera aphidicola TaxID=9 RepID=UPI0031B80FE3
MEKIQIKDKEAIEKMEAAGKLTSEVLEMIELYIFPGITTEKIDKICHDYIIYEQKAIPACLGYKGFPKSTCISINNTVCHGIPNSTKLQDGDIVNVDVSVIKNGYHGDASKMFMVGSVNERNKKLCEATKNSLYIALKLIKPGIKISILGSSIQNYIFKKKLSIVEEYCGHGIGRKFHEEPQILHYKNEHQKTILKPGMTFTIEPMINLGKKEVYCCSDGWTIKTKDQSYSAQYEHTVLVTNNGCNILTIQKEENINKILINNK